MEPASWISLAIPAIREAINLAATFRKENGRDPDDAELAQILQKPLARRELNARLEDSLENRMADEAQQTE